MPARRLTLLSTLAGSRMAGFYPRGWDLARMDACAALDRSTLLAPMAHWHEDFRPCPVRSVAEMDRRMGLEIAHEITRARRQGRPLALILPVGPMGMYRHTVRALRAARITCDHVSTFNMDEWSDARGRSMPGDQAGGFQHAMKQALFDPLGRLTVPASQRNFATAANLPTYAAKIADIRARGGRLVTVYGIGRTCHIAFWEPDQAARATVANWRRQTHALAVPLHPLTIEQNAITSFGSRFTQVPCFANTIGPGLFLASDRAIGGCDGGYPDRGAQWQGMSVCVTLRHPPSPWLPSTYMPTLPGRLFVLSSLLGPLGISVR